MPKLQKNKTSLHVMNRRAVNPTVQGTPFYGELQQQKVLNTLQAGQITASIYIRKSGGLECTCSGETQLLDTSGNLTEDSIQTVLKGTQGVTNRQTFSFDDFDRDENTSDGFIVESDLDGDGIDDDMDFDFLEFGAVSCSVCYSSGWVGGYDLFNGYRLVLATPSPHMGSGFTVDSTVSPHAFAPKSGETSTVDFTCVVPFGATISKFRLRNNHDTIPYAEYQMFVFDGTSWVTVTNLSDLATGVPRNFRITTSRKFTHFEANYIVNNSVTYIDFPQFATSTFSKNLLGDNGETEMHIGADVPSLPRWSIVKENKYNRIWQVTEMTPVYDSAKTVINWELNTRLVHEQENVHDIL
ncbi:hypothetical protein GR7B_00095 [Vibrio phage vB_VcorM_GR7B]|nr:hypothetical protein GR7B_00095 [Vibrio phage vB_VcorM_GR7B]